MLFDEIPWQDPIMKTKTYYVFKALDPVSNGHVVFVPKVAEWDYLADCYKAAYMWGYDWVQDEYCTGFRLVQNVGEPAGQTVKYPCVELITTHNVNSLKIQEKLTIA